jgi:hypothetical protein
MSTTWTLTATDIYRGALEICGAVGSGQTASAEDTDICARALDGVLKELPLHGLSWPKISSAATSVAWSSGAPSKVTPPADYFGVPVLKYADANGVLRQLVQIAKPAYEALNATQTAQFPSRFYVAPDNSFYLWPVPTQEPSLKLTYQAIESDAVINQRPDIQQAWLNGFQYWVANEVSQKMGVPPSERQEIAARFQEKKFLMLQWSTDLAPISFTVDNN